MVVRDATLEIRTSIVFATVIIVLVFLPIFGLSGVEGRLLTPLAYAYIVALLASLGVAIVVTPALCYAFLPGAAVDHARARRVAGAHAEGAVRAGAAVRARSSGRWSPASRVLLLAAAALATTRFGTAFLPEFHEGSLTISVNTLPGTSLAKSDEIGRRVEQILLAQPEVVATARRTGRAELDEHVQGVEAAEIDVGLRESEPPARGAARGAAAQLRGLPGTNVAIGQPISHRIDHMLSGTRANIAVKIFGDDLVTLRRLGERVRDAMSGVEGVADLSLEQQTDIPFVRFVLNRPAIARYGLRVQDVAEAIETSFAGTVVGRVFDRATAFDLVVKLDPSASVDFERIADLPVHTPTGESVPIRVLADVRREMGPNMILRENVQRRIVVSCNVAAAISAASSRTSRRRWPSRCRCPTATASSTAGSSRASRARRETAAAARRRRRSPGLFMMLVLAFGRATRRAAGHAQPAAGAHRRRGGRVPGGRRAERGLDHRVHHAVRHRDAQRHHAGLAHPAPDASRRASPNFREAVERGAHERLIPILMTAMAAGLALIPLALGGGEPGSEIQTPMAIVILCGLTTSTLLNMFVVPTLYLRYAEPTTQRALNEG